MPSREHSGVAAGAHHLPAPVSSFVGRSAQREALLQVLRDNRLVTFVGAPGVGKTRLALEVARGTTEFCDTAWWVDLGLIGDADGVVLALARSLGVQEDPGAPVLEAVAAKLRGEQALIVLDNCEHLLEACATTVRTLLDSSDGIRVLATSRQPLGVPGEQRCEVASLSVSDYDDSPDAVAATEAGQLFCERATAVQPQFVLDTATAPHVAEICRRLDGIALPIELAAARVAVLSPAEIVDHLVNWFALLKNDQATIPTRHQTLLAALEWSYDLLSPPEQVMLRRLAVFWGGATVEAVQAVCTGADIAAADALELLTSLANKSLVVVEAPGAAPARYRLLETVWVYTTRLLTDPGEKFDLATRHARWFSALAEQAKPHLTGSEPDRWLARLAAYYVDLSAALTWTRAHGDGDEALRLASSLTMYWRLRGQFTEGRQCLDAALAQCPDADPAVRAEGLWGAGLLALMADDAGAGELLEESLRLYRQLDDTKGQGRAALLLGNHLLVQADAARAGQLLEESIALARKADDPWCLANGLALSALVHLDGGHTGAGRGLLEEARAVARVANEPQGARMALTLLGRLAARDGDYSLAEKLLTKALLITNRLQEPSGAWTAMQALARVAAGRGDYARAEELLEAGMRLERQRLGPQGATVGVFLLGRLSLDTGNLARAGQLFEQLLAVLGPLGIGAYPILAGRASVAALRGDVAWARTSLNKALVLEEFGGERFRPGSLLYDFDAGSVRYDLGNVARMLGDGQAATRLHTEAFQMREAVGDLPGMVQSLEALAGLEAESGHAAVAARMLGAAQAVRDSRGYARAPILRDRYRADVEAVRSMMDEDEFEALWADGTKVSLFQAAGHFGSAPNAHSREDRWENLSPAELGVVALVAEGLSNREIAERLFVAQGTVKVHLHRIFVKLGVDSRVQLALEADRRQS